MGRRGRSGWEGPVVAPPESLDPKVSKSYLPKKKAQKIRGGWGWGFRIWRFQVEERQPAGNGSCGGVTATRVACKIFRAIIFDQFQEICPRFCQISHCTATITEPLHSEYFLSDELFLCKLSVP